MPKESIKVIEGIFKGEKVEKKEAQKVSSAKEKVVKTVKKEAK